MNLLLDTHVWLWRLRDPDRVRAEVDALLDEEGTVGHLSAASVWEAMILARKGRLRVGDSAQGFVTEAIRTASLSSLEITVPIALRSESLDGLGTADPVDRFIVATALEHNLTLVTADATLLAYEPLDTLAA